MWAPKLYFKITVHMQVCTLSEHCTYSLLRKAGKTSHARGPLHYLSEQVFDKCFLDQRALTAQRSKRKFGDRGWLAQHHPVREWQGQNKGSSILLPASKPSHRRKVTES